MKKIANTKKQFSLSKKTRIWLGVLLAISVIIPILSFGKISVLSAGYLICTIFLFATGEHSETVIIGFLLCSLSSLITAIAWHCPFLMLIIPVLFSAFIIFSLYRPINAKVVKDVSWAYLIYVIVQVILGAILNVPAFHNSLMSLNIWQIASSIIIPLVFVFATYEDAEQNAFGQIIFLINSVLASALSLIHLGLYFTAESLLKGHTYGRADRFGDYARGLTHSEVASIDRIIPAMWIIIVALAATWLINAKIPNTLPTFDASKQSAPVKRPKTYKVMEYLIIIIGICIIGSVWVTIKYAMYN